MITGRQSVTVAYHDKGAMLLFNTQKVLLLQNVYSIVRIYILIVE